MWILYQKFDSIADKGIFIGYSTSYDYQVYNTRIFIIEESMHVVFTETNDLHEKRSIIDLEEELEQLNLNDNSSEKEE